MECVFKMRGAHRAAVAATALAALALPASAQAHVEAGPAKVPAGQASAIALHVGHGCEESPTTRLTVRLPEGARSVRPLRTAGWRASERATEGVREVSWSGGSLPSGQAEEFRLRVALPGAPGDIVYLKAVQRCASGQTNWVEIPGDGSTELEAPAPFVTLTKGPVREAPAHEGGDHHRAEGEKAARRHDPRGEEAAASRPDALRTTAAATVEDGGLSGSLIAALIAGGLLLAGGAAMAARRLTRKGSR